MLSQHWQGNLLAGQHAIVLVEVNSTRAFQKIDFNWLIQLILNFSLGRVELISQIHKYPQPNFIIIIINGGNMPVTKTHLTY